MTEINNNPEKASHTKDVNPKAIKVKKPGRNLFLIMNSWADKLHLPGGIDQDLMTRTDEALKQYDEAFKQDKEEQKNNNLPQDPKKLP